MKPHPNPAWCARCQKPCKGKKGRCEIYIGLSNDPFSGRVCNYPVGYWR